MTEVKKRLEKILTRTKIDKNGCLIYQGRIDNITGYSRILLGGKNRNGHRVVLILSTGIDPKKFEACHSCDVRSCINPDHLWWGTKKQNHDDLVKKRKHWTQLNPKKWSNQVKLMNRKLTDKQVIKIRALATCGKYSQNEIAKMFKISQPHVSQINTSKKRIGV